MADANYGYPKLGDQVRDQPGFVVETRQDQATTGQLRVTIVDPDRT